MKNPDTSYATDLVLRLTGWAHNLAWVTLLFSMLGGLIAIGFGVAGIWNDEIVPAMTGAWAQSQGDLQQFVFDQVVKGFQIIFAGLASFIFLKGFSEGLFILMDFEENTRRPGPDG